MPKKTETKPEKTDEIKIFNRPDLPTLYASRATFTKFNDGHAMLGFYCPTMNGEFEHARVMLTEEHVKRIIDLMCLRTGHYPVAPAK